MTDFGRDPLDSALHKALKPYERVMWQGRPLSRFDWSPLVIWLFAIPWTGFALFWTWMAWTITTRDPQASQIEQVFGLLFPAFGLPFIAVGLAMMVLPLLAVPMPGYSLYAVTDRRVLRVIGGWKPAVRSIPGEAINGLNLAPRADGSGTLHVMLDRSKRTLDMAGKRRMRLSGTTQWSMRHIPYLRDAARAVERLRISSGSSSRSAGPDR